MEEKKVPDIKQPTDRDARPIPVIEAERISKAAIEQNVSLRLIGGTAIYFLCATARKQPLCRNYHDADFVGRLNDNPKIKKVFDSLGYLPDKRFNTLHGHQRLLFLQPEMDLVIDVFLDHLMQCHDLDFRKRLDNPSAFLPLADLFLSKTQVVKINEKDIRDVICILNDYSFGTDDDEKINLKYISNILGNDWGFWKTVTTNLGLIEDYILDKFGKDEFHHSLKNVQELRTVLNNCPKTIRWKLRGIIGERMIWYDEPEEVKAIL